MADLPDPWGAYARQQQELSQKSQVDDKAWGLEAGLNLILATDPALNSPSQDAIDRAVASCARLERYRARLRAIHLNHEEPTGNADLKAIEALQSLQLIESRVADDDWVLLCEVAEGNEYAEVAAHRDATAGSLRARVFRLRRSLMAVAT